MRDIDFDELDKAVNNYLVDDGSSAKAEPIKVDEKKNAAHSASDLHESKAPIPRRSGRFMDIMTKPPKTTILSESEVKKPVKYTAEANATADILDDFREKSKPERHIPAKNLINDSLTSNGSIDLPEPEFEEPVLESLAIDENIIEPENQILDDFIEPENKEDQSFSQPAEENAMSREIKMTEPILEDIKPEESILTDEIIMSSEPGVFEIDDEEDLKVFNKTILPEPNSVKDFDFGIKKGVEPLPKNNLLLRGEEIKSLPEKTDEQPLITPFLPNARVEKRPLGARKDSIDENESKIINSSAPKNRTKNENSNIPLLSNDEYATPIKPRKKKSGWLVILAVILLIIVGAGGGALAYFLLMM